jgi:hypothetical protein
MADHMHICIAIAPKFDVASMIGFLKGKSAIALARMQGKERNDTRKPFWHAAMRSQQQASMKSKSAPVCVSKKVLMVKDAFRFKEQFAQLSRLRDGTAHQATDIAGGV